MGPVSERGPACYASAETPQGRVNLAVPLHMHLPVDAEQRKNLPLARGLLDYFPDALAYVAMVSKAGNDQHNPGQDIHWARGKSTDHADCIMRHLIDRGLPDITDGLLHSGKLAWRALALLQMELEALGSGWPRGAREPVTPVNKV